MMLGQRLLTVGVAGCAVAWLVRCTRRRLSIRETPSKDDLRQGFIRALQECDTIIVSNIPNLKEKLCTLLDADYFVAALQQLPKSNAAEKRRLWAQLKATAFSRLYASVISAAHLSVISRVHIAIVTGIAMESTRRNEAPPHFPDPVVHFIHYGLPRICSDIHKLVSEEMNDIPLNQRIKRQDFKILLKRIEMSLKGVIWNMTEYIMPVSVSGYSDESMVALHDVLGSRDVREAVLDNLVGVGMAYLSSILAQEVAWTDDENGLEDVVCGGEVMAKIIPVVCHSIHSSFVSGKDGLFYPMMADKDLTKLTGNVYECFAA